MISPLTIIFAPPCFSFLHPHFKSCRHVSFPSITATTPSSIKKETFAVDKKRLRQALSPEIELVIDPLKQMFPA